MRKVTLVLLCFLVAACFFSCGQGKKRADRAAEVYYGYLMDGKCKKFVNGIAYRDSMTEEYHRQMVLLMKQYVKREKQRHGGIVAVEAQPNDAESGTTTVFLQVCYADSTSEEIAVPMVKCGDEWKMQ